MAITKCVVVPTPTTRVDAAETSTSSQNHPTKKSRRRVSFANSNENQTYENKIWTKQEGKSFWYTKKEIKLMKDEFSVDYKTIQNDDSKEDMYKQALWRVYDACCHQAESEASMLLSFTFSSTNTTNKKNTLLLSKHETKQLRKLFGKQMDRLGLERLCVADVASGHRRSRQSIGKEVLQAHKEYSANSPLSVAEQAEILRLSCEAISLPSRLFAQHVAAVAAAANNPKVQKRIILHKLKRRASC